MKNKTRNYLEIEANIMASVTMKQLNDPFEMTESEAGSVIWRYFDSPEGPTWKAYLEDPALARQIQGWQGVGPGATYFRPDGVKFGEDLVIPKRLLRRTLKLIGLSFQRRKPTEAELTNLRQGQEKLFGQSDYVSGIALDSIGSKPVDEHTQTERYQTTPSGSSFVSGQNIAPKQENS